MTESQLSVLAVVWFVAVPAAVAGTARNIAEEKIFEGLLAWIDLRYRGTKIGYLFRCPVCLSHWLAGLAGLLFWPAWRLLPFSGALQFVVALTCVGAAAHIARALWLE